MHNILRLKKSFQSRKSSKQPSSPRLPANSFVEIKHLKNLRNQLEKILTYWRTDTKIGGALISVYYTRIIAKSNRIQKLLMHPSKSVRGARFEQIKGTTNYCHIFTHFVSLDEIENTIYRLQTVEEIVSKRYNGKITDNDIDKVGKNGLHLNSELISTMIEL